MEAHWKMYRVTAETENPSQLYLKHAATIFGSFSYYVTIFQRKWKYVLHFTHTLLFILYTDACEDRHTDRKFEGLAASADALVRAELLKSGKCMGLVVRVTNINKITNCPLLSKHITIIDSTDL